MIPFDSPLAEFKWRQKKGRTARLAAIAREFNQASASDVAIILTGYGVFAGAYGLHARIITGWHPEFNHAIRSGLLCDPASKRWDGAASCWKIRDGEFDLQSLRTALTDYFSIIIVMDEGSEQRWISIQQAPRLFVPSSSFELLDRPLRINVDSILTEIETNQPTLKDAYILADFASTGRMLQFYRVDKLLQGGELYTIYPLLLFRVSVWNGRPRYFSFNVLANTFDARGFHGDKASKVLIGQYRSAIDRLRAPVLQPEPTTPPAVVDEGQHRLANAERLFRRLVADYRIAALPAFHYTITDLTDALAWTPLESSRGLLRVGLRLAGAESTAEAFPIAFSRHALRELSAERFSDVCIHEFGHVIDQQLKFGYSDFFHHGHSWLAAVTALLYLNGETRSIGCDYLLDSGHCTESEYYRRIFGDDTKEELRRLESMVRTKFASLLSYSERPHTLDEICSTIEMVLERWEREVRLSMSHLVSFARNEASRMSCGHR